MKYKTILFDLDDTIFDHQYACRCALTELNNNYNLSTIPIKEFGKIYQYYLELTFNKILENKITVADSRKERLSLFFDHFGKKLKNDDELLKADSIYRNAYNKNRQSIPGVIKLINELKKHSKIGIITNGLVVTQNEKIKICKIENDIDYLFISEAMGYIKPEKEFFIKALEKINISKDQCIVIGDSWESDILGAYNSGIKSIWINRYELKCPDPDITTEINSYENFDELIKLFSLKNTKNFIRYNYE